MIILILVKKEIVSGQFILLSGKVNTHQSKKML